MVVKNPVRLLRSANVSLSSVTPTTVVDGKEVRLNDRILLIGQTDGVQNGIYVVTANGLNRSDDLPAGATGTGVYVFVDEGDEFLDRSYICITDQYSSGATASAVVGTDSLTWVQFSARPSAMAGNGLVVGTGNALDVNVDNATLEIITDTLRIKNPDIKFEVERGLLRSSTNGTAETSPVVDSGDAAVLGATIGLGTNVTVQPDFTVIPDLQATNTFTSTNAFSNTDAASWTVSTPGAEPVLAGAVVVAGGLAVRKNVVATEATLEGTTDASSVSTGTLVVDGGAGIAKNLYVGTNATVTGTLFSNNATVTHDVTSDTLHVLSTTNSASAATGAVIVSGGIGVGQNITVGGDATVTGVVDCDTAHCRSATSATWNASALVPLTGALTVDGGCSVRAEVLCARGHVYDTVDSTSTSTGAFLVDGGAAVNKNLYVGSNANVALDVSCNSAHVTTQLNCATAVASDTTESTSRSTGAVTVAGGLGVMKAVNCATMNATSPATVATWSATDPLGGALTVDGSASVRNALLVGSLSVQTDTDSTSVTTGCLTLSGGLGVAKNITSTTHNVVSSTDSTSITTGALTVAGGVGVGLNLKVGQGVACSSATVSGNVSCNTEPGRPQGQYAVGRH